MLYWSSVACVHWIHYHTLFSIHHCDCLMAPSPSFRTFPTFDTKFAISDIAALESRDVRQRSQFVWKLLGPMHRMNPLNMYMHQWNHVICASFEQYWSYQSLTSPLQRIFVPMPVHRRSAHHQPLPSSGCYKWSLKGTKLTFLLF